MKNRWQPVYEDWTESPVNFRSTPLETFSGPHNDYGVVFHGEVEDKENNSALFWIDPQHIYLRLDWANWYAVSCEDAPTCTELCRRSTAVLMIYDDNNLRMRPLKVYHLDDLPDNLFAMFDDCRLDDDPDEDNPEDIKDLIDSLN